MSSVYLKLVVLECLLLPLKYYEKMHNSDLHLLLLDVVGMSCAPLSHHNSIGCDGVQKVQHHNRCGCKSTASQQIIGALYSPSKPLPETACRMLFDVIFKGCMQGSLLALKILKQVIDGSCPEPKDASCLSPSEPKHPNRLSNALDWVPSDAEFLQVCLSSQHKLPACPPALHAIAQLTSLRNSTDFASLLHPLLACVCWHQPPSGAWLSYSCTWHLRFGQWFGSL